MPATFRHELARKSLHLATIVIPLAYARLALPRGLVVAALGGLLAVALLVEVARARSARVGHVFGRLVGALLRAHERSDARAITLSGATWMLLAFTLAAACFPREVAVAAMAAVSLGDAAAALVGRAIGRIRLTSGKSLEGALACALATMLGALVVARLDVATSLVAGGAAALAELPTRPFDDNVRVALATGVAILLWRITLY